MTYDLYTPLLRALAKFKNVQSDFAKAIGVKPMTINQWLYRNRKIPHDHVPTVSRVTGIPKHELRPDKPHLFPPP